MKFNFAEELVAQGFVDILQWWRDHRL